MAKKKLYFKFSDNGDVNNVVMDLSACMAWIKNDNLKEKDSQELELYQYTLTPIMLTDEEFEKLPEANY